MTYYYVKCLIYLCERRKTKTVLVFDVVFWCIVECYAAIDCFGCSMRGETSEHLNKVQPLFTALWPVCLAEKREESKANLATTVPYLPRCGRFQAMMGAAFNGFKDPGL